ncbi:MAG: hypothetical protein EXR07_17040 [Acetobacteraceae bacterium]|nr:hypothetical protein [Acetobacteraceae bacterium]
MRRLTPLVAFLIAAFGTLMPLADAAGQCASGADQSVNDIQALRTQILVLTLSCGQQAAYNSFVLRFRPVLQANDRDVSAWFQRAYGAAGEARKDTFVTDLSNTMSQTAERSGGRTCAFAAQTFNELNGLRSSDQLPAYAAAKRLSPPGLSMCQGAARSR